MREFKSGNTTIIINSPIMELTEEERKEWYRKELEAGNPIMLNIVKAINDCYRKYD